MNPWQLAALTLILAMIPTAVVMARSRTMNCLVALEFATTAAVLALMLICEGVGRPSYFDIPLTLALLSYPASLLFAHFYERWL